MYRYVSTKICFIMCDDFDRIILTDFFSVIIRNKNIPALQVFEKNPVKKQKKCIFGNFLNCLKNDTSL